MIATSREALGVAGERVCPIDPLPVPPAGASLEDIGRRDAGALFLSRLPRNLITAPLSPSELAAVGAICRRLEGIPLGLELAAARSRTLPLPVLAERLSRSIKELVPHRHGVTPRHRTMRAALDWGYQLLSPSAQVSLRAMSVFAGGCDLAAFASVCLDDDAQPALEVLDELVRTSFVIVDLSDESARYRLLEPIRQYAAELNDQSGDSADRHRRHLQHYLDVARSSTEDVDGVGETNVELLRVELGNFRAALDWAATDMDGVEAGLSIGARLWKLWTSDGHHEEGLSRLTVLLGSGAGSTEARSQAAYRAGFFAVEMGDDERALELWRQALDEAVAGGDKLGEVRARRVLSEDALLRCGDIDTARRHIDTAIRIATGEANDLLVARCTLELAYLDSVTGALDEARNRAHSILTGPVGTVPAIEIRALGVLVAVLFDQGDYASARIAATKVLAIAECTHVLSTVVGAHLDLAAIETAAGRLDEAAAHIATAVSLNPEIAHTWDPAFLIARADLALARGHNAEALAYAEQAVAIEGESYSAGAQGVANLRWLGDAQLAVGNATDALNTFERLIARAGAAHDAIRLAEGNEGCAAAAYALGNSHDAHEYLTAATEIRQRTRSQRLPRLAIDRCLITLESRTANRATDVLTAGSE